VTPREWLTTAEAGAVLDRTPHYVGHLARTGQLASRKDGQVVMVDGHAVREGATRAAEWVSYNRAAKLVGCSPTAILHAVQRGEIARRRAEHRAQPALSRDSVEAFASEWATQQEAKARVRAQRAANRLGPPDDEHVWLKPTTAALVLGMSTSRLRQLASQERIPFTQQSGRRWYRRDHVEQAAARRTATWSPPWTEHP
jgi:hypothetical protein